MDNVMRRYVETYTSRSGREAHEVVEKDSVDRQPVATSGGVSYVLLHSTASMLIAMFGIGDFVWRISIASGLEPYFHYMP